MIELVATTIITVSSALLFGYWYRYTCLLILSAKTTKDYAGEVAAANQLTFAEVQAQLRSGNGTAEMDRLQQALDRDYNILTFLFRNSTAGQVEYRLEDTMLQLDYRLMSALFRVGRHFSDEFARKALDEMSMVVAHFANSLGERVAEGAAA